MMIYPHTAVVLGMSVCAMMLPWDGGSPDRSAAPSAGADQPSACYEVSPDGLAVRGVCHDQPTVVSRLVGSTVPYGTTPDWQNTVRRQVASVKAADIDNDGDIDLVVGCYTSNSFPPYTDWHNLIYRNVGGHLEADASWISADQVHTGEVVVADLNLDGWPDVFAANGGSSHSASVIYFGSPTGPSTTPGWASATPQSTWATSAIGFDFDHDGDIDIVTTNQSAIQSDPYRPIYMFRNNNGVLEATPSWQSSEFSIQNGLAVGDYDNDGWQDLVVAKWVNFQSAIYRNINGTLATTPAWTSGSTSGAKGAAIAHIDSNGLRDVAFGYDPTRLYSQVAPGNFTNTWTSAAPVPSVQELQFVDVDQDGDMDLAEVNFSTGRLHIYLNNNGVLDTTPSWTYDSPLVGNGLDFGDINGDGRPDLIMGLSGQPSVVIFYAHPPACPADLTHDASVNIDDLLTIINNWGPCAGCGADITGNGVVNIDDLLAVINAWGACP